MDTNEIIRHLQLLPHPEGGYFRETYRSAEMLTNSAGKTRNVSTAIRTADNPPQSVERSATHSFAEASFTIN
ncbi:MAG: cupin domain-containing protein [Mangrovibacterium sp.]